MAGFSYEAIDKNGKEIKGSIEAESTEKAISELKNQGIMVLDISEQGILNKDISFDIGKKPSARDLSVFCRQFVSMIRAGVTILDALRMLSEATENKKLKEAITGVRTNAEKGESLASSLAEYPKIFPSIMVNMIAAGEASGSLDVSMERMATQFERTNKTQSLVKKAMIYPIMVGLVATIVIVVMLVVVIPSYVEMFEDMGTELPGITLAVMSGSEFIITYWFLLLPLIIGGVIGIASFKKTENGQHFFGKIALKIPALATLVTKTAAAQMARTLSTLLGAGVPLIEAVEITSSVMGNVYFKEALENAKEEIVIGQPLSRPLETCGLFPPMVYYMVRIGEEAGNSEEMLDKLADYYEEEVESAVQAFVAAMEPMIILVLAAIVCVLIGACMAPMLQMYTALDSL